MLKSLQQLVIPWRRVPLLVMTAVTLLVLLFVGSFWIKILFLSVLIVMGLLFFDPERIPAETTKDVILSPVDGKIIDVRVDKSAETPLVVAVQKNLFTLSVLRSPFASERMHVSRKEGLALFVADKRAKTWNTQMRMDFELNNGSRAFLGLVGGFWNRDMRLMKDEFGVGAGERIAFMHEGMLFLGLPKTAQLQVDVGRQVRAGEDVIGYIR